MAASRRCKLGGGNIGGRLIQARVFLMMVQYSAVTVQYSVYCIVSTQCDQLCVMSVFSRDLFWIFLVRVHVFSGDDDSPGYL